MGRPLTARERDVLAFMVDNAVPSAGDRPVPAAARERWRRSIPTTTAGRGCECGACPSIDLVDERARTSKGGRSVVLSAEHPKASVLLFIDADRLSYLELAPHGDEAIDHFPSVAELSV
ncbi:hypothetical protein I2485_04185 [Nesterenkonia sp. E16_7]|uniref:hypothetical protein n=1 Tax=unclassified Nesterenkonia TaxID=2629769 RepID=UPI001A90FF35|nr:MULTISPECIES: hypothetical protein [unclassified Nesterenkonia]MBO0596498.1 hypothetical protein [Nesterenkonia sp. E16_10]MBO0597844.1 hypothetical protein [Nesterenkonia sp. E16_7]